MHPLHWKGGVLITGPPRKFSSNCLAISLLSMLLFLHQFKYLHLLLTDLLFSIHSHMMPCVSAQLLCCVQLFVKAWTVATRLLCPWDSPGKNAGVGCHFFLQETFPTQGLNPCLLHCRQRLYCLSHQGTSKIMVASFNRSHACAGILSAPHPAAGHRRPTPPLETAGHSRASLGQFLVGSLLPSSGSWCTQGFVCALQESVSSPV